MSVDDRQLVEFDRDGAGDVLGLAAAFGRAHGDDLADEAKLAGGQDRLRRTLEALQRWRRYDRLDAGEIVGGEDRVAKPLRDTDFL